MVLTFFLGFALLRTKLTIALCIKKERVSTPLSLVKFTLAMSRYSGEAEGGRGWGGVKGGQGRVKGRTKGIEGAVIKSDMFY